MKGITLFFFCLANTLCTGQILRPVKWSYASKKLDQHTAVVYFKADIDTGWHVYSVNQPAGGPIKTSFAFEKNNAFSIMGKTTEPNPKKHFEKTFGVDVLYFEHSVIFQQKVLLKRSTAIVKGKLTYMICNDHQCLPPEDLDFEIPIK